MKDSSLTRHIIEYASSTSVEYAFMLRGDWGIGKTYYYRNALVPLLEKQERTPVGANNSVKLKPIYISLFGISDNDFHKHIVLSCSTAKELIDTYFPTFKRIIKKASDSVTAKALYSITESQIPALGSMNFSSKSLDSLDNKKGLFICFDDLERSSISPNIFLAAINQLTEFLNIPVLIVCNEAKYFNDYKDAVQQLSTDSDTSSQEVKSNPYKLGKEKCIRSVDFDPDIGKTIKLIFESCKMNKAQDFFIKHADRLAAVFTATGCNNLRFIKRIIGDFRNHIFPAWEKIQTKFTDDNRLYDMFIFYSACVIELDFKRIPQKDFHSLLSDPFLFKKEKHLDYDILKHRKMYFIDYPFDSYQRQEWFNSIFDFAKKGFIDTAHLIQECRPQFVENLADVSQVLNIPSANWFSMDDTRFTKAYTTVLSALRQKIIVTEENFFKSYHLLKMLAEKKAVSISDAERIELMDKNFEALYEGLDDEFVFNGNFSNFFDSDKKLFDYFTRLNQKSDENIQKKKAKFLDEMIKTVCSGHSVRTLNRHNDELYGTFGFKEVHAEILYDALTENGNDIACEICEFLIWRFDGSKFPGKIRQETDFIHRLNSKIENYFSLNKIAPRNLNLLALSEKLTKLEETFSETQTASENCQP